MKHQREEQLLKKYLDGTCTPQEKAIVESWYIAYAHRKRDQTPDLDHTALKNQLWEKLEHLHHKQQHTGKFRKIYTAIAAAAAIIIVFSLIHVQKNTGISKEPLYTSSDVLPAADKALLTLDNGKVITLDQIDSTELVTITGLKITKTADGHLLSTVPESMAGRSPEANQYQQISTPKGGKYQIILPDGSKVWLNSASSIRYPVVFKDARAVTLVGEAYFEIAQLNSKLGNGKRPFRIETNRQQVEVLGTHFNINAFGDEQFTTTTLIEGSVKVVQKTTGKTQTLSPGQQAVLADQVMRVEKANVNEIMAWKNGQFVFENTDLKSILRQLSRWYDVEIDTMNLPDARFNGEISRNVKLSQVLEMLEITSDLKFKVEGRRVTRTR